MLGKTLAITSNEDSIILWNLFTDEKINTLISNMPQKELERYRNYIHYIDYNADTEKMAVAQGGQATIWNPFPAGGKELKTFKDPIRPGNASVTRVALSPNGTLLGVVSLYAITLWDIKSGNKQILMSEFHESSARHFDESSIKFSPDGNTLAISDGNNITLWESDAAKLKTLSLRQLLVFLIHIKLRAFSTSLKTDFDQLPANVKELLKKQ